MLSEGYQYEREQRIFEMEMEAQLEEDILSEHTFTVEGVCRACLQRCQISPLHLCESCDDQNDRTGGALIELIDPTK